MNAIEEYRARLRADVDAINDIADELGSLDATLREQRDLTQAVIAKVDAALELINNPGARRRGVPVEYLRAEPTPGRDEVAIVVLRDSTGSALAASTMDVASDSSLRLRWDPMINALGFVDRTVLASIRLTSIRDGLGDRVVVLDPKKARCGWDDLHGLIIGSPSHVRHLAELAKAIVGGTHSVALLKSWAEHRDVKLDPHRLRPIAERLRRVEAAASAAE